MKMLSFALSPFALSPIMGLLCSGLAAQQPGPDSAPAARFDWPVPGRVAVTETVFKGGKTIKMRYTLRVTRTATGGLRVRYTDFAFLELQGRDVTAPQFRQKLAPALAITSAIPDFLISAGGTYERVVGIDAMTDRLETMLGKVRKVSPEESAKRRAFYRRRQFKELMQASMSKYWDSWVGTWLEWEIPAGQSIERKVESPFLGKTVPAEMRVTHHGPARNKPGYVRLSVRSVAKGEKINAAMSELVASLGAAPLGEGRSATDFGAVRIDSHVEAVTRLDNLRPAWVRTEQTIRVQQKGQTRPMEKVERHEYVFDWSKQ